MKEKVKAYMEQHHMAPKGSRIVAGVSGGADSVCLLLLLKELSREYQWQLLAVHVNHGIRKEAEEDAEYVRQLCKSLEVPFCLIEKDVATYAKKEHLSEEEAGRKVRYEAFLQAAADFYKTEDYLIAVAHNKNDRAETFLFHLLRGTGLSGMASIRPVRDNVIRPLLFADRSEIEEYLKKKGILWCTDATNKTDAYARNRIRNVMLPYAEENICQRSTDHLAEEAELLLQVSDFVDRQTKKTLERCLIKEAAEGICLDTASFLQEVPLLRSCMIRECLKELSEGGKDLTKAHIDAVEELFWGQSGREVMLPYKIRGRRDFSRVILFRETKKQISENRKNPSDSIEADNINAALQEETSWPVIPGQCIRVPGLGMISSKILENVDISQPIPEKKYTKWFDYDKIIECVEFRHRRPGDYLMIDIEGEEGRKLGKKKLKTWLVEQKIPQTRRNEILVLAMGSHILWVPEGRISAQMKVTEHTRRILEVHITGGKEHG